MYDLEQVVRERRSTRMFLPHKPVPRELMDEALALAVRAPSNSNIHPESPSRLNVCGECAPEMAHGGESIRLMFRRRHLRWREFATILVVPSRGGVGS